MKRLTVAIKIQADKSRIWDVLWNDETYRKWTSVFFEGSHVVCEDWKEGNIVMFLAPDKNGMFSLIEKCIPNEIMSFKHLGMVKDGERQPINEEESWYGIKETYRLIPEEGGILLKAELDTDEKHMDSMRQSFNEALGIIKSLSEK